MGGTDSPVSLLSGHSAVARILQAVLVALLGFALLNAAFMLDFLYQSVFERIARLFMDPEEFHRLEWMRTLMNLSFMALMVAAAYLVLKSGFHMVIKAAFFAVPTATVLLITYITLYPRNTFAVALCVIEFLAALSVMLRNRVHWLYFFSFLLTAASLAAMALLGIDI